MSDLKAPGRASWQRRGLSRPERVIRFLEGLPITKGHLAGRRMKLLPSQREFVQQVYGRLDDNGKRVIRLAVKSEPRGNGKTGLLAGLALAHLCGPEAQERGEIYSAAVDRNQASIIFNEMRAIIQANPDLEARINILKHWKKIEVLDGPGVGSVYESLSSDARRGPGLAPSFWVFDELGQVRDRELLDALMTAMGKQPESLGIVISTQAASDDHPLSQLIDDGLRGIDPSMYVQLVAAPEDADPFSEDTWKAYNPAYGVFLDMDDFKRQAARAQRMPSFLAAFKNLRLNQRIYSDARFLAAPDWKACAGAVDRAALRGHACWGGLDLSSTTDLTALVLYFPDDAGAVLAWFWLPGAEIEERERRDRVPYRAWQEQGLIELTPGRAIDKRAVAFRLAELAAEFEIQGIAFDRWRIKDLQKTLEDEGIELPLVEFGQGYQSMGPAVDALETAILDQGIKHGGNPILTWNAGNAVIEMDPAGNRKLSKARSLARIDGLVALTMAKGLHAKHPAPAEFDFNRDLVLSA